MRTSRVEEEEMATAADNRRWTYPAADQDDVVEDYHGTPVRDPYRYMEDPDDPRTTAWVDAQNRLSRAYFDGYPERQRTGERLEQLWNYPRYGLPERRGDRYFFAKNDGLQDQSVLYMVDTLDGDPRVLLDPNLLSEDGTAALSTQVLSDDGKLLAYGVSHSGSDWQEIFIRNVDSGQDLDDVIRWARFTGIAWKRDNSGFFYNRFPEPGTVPDEDLNNYSKVYWHRLGTPQSEDVLVYEWPDDKELGFHPFMTEDGRYLGLYVYRGTDPRNGLYYRQAGSDDEFVRLLEVEEATYNPIGNVGSVFYLHTDLGAPRGRVVAIDLERPERDHWIEIIGEQEDVINAVALVADHLVVQSMHNAYEVLRVHELDGQLAEELELPGIGSIGGISGRQQDKDMFFAFTSFVHPTTVYRYDFETRTITLFRESEISFDPEEYETRQVFYTSRDGTKVSMFLTHRRDLEPDGESPVLLYGYGGFNISLTPAFSVSRIIWLERGGVYAVANLRGGNEYGEEWHQGGTLERKQNVFDDFIAGAEWLVENRYTRPGKLAINGGSNGGLLVTACAVQRPELFGAVVAQVPVTDMLRYQHWTVGRYWVPEYGNAEEDPEHFRFLYAYSPLHNVKKNVPYPATLVSSADTDDRVVPAHAKKFIATVQEADAGTNPILIRVETKAGHGVGKPTTKMIEEQNDIYAFLFRALEI
jgi:prolyl oligopeptidase